MIEQKLKIALLEAADHFRVRGISEWESEARDAVNRLENDDLSFVEKMWLKYAPTCEVEDLLITDYEVEAENEVNILNAQLAEIANKVFWLLDSVKNDNT
ncbi:hypothetical protein [Gallaecimonas xiamenensis]|uniref:Uncharacterized protein n=1 Tax=Gallaecimonas xiamenensis 3-C-1 TaxID=745411 RepID=K2J2V4_9GAMM|nr:hypothetical protein [Gallaecimonas xiamenensis]EKE69438.1 hypothetical protein B3C1_15042 [Gallaecimonas xiamenensis 3-C-1]